MEDLIKALPEGYSDVAGENFLRHLEEKKNVLRTFDEIQRRLDSLENPVMPKKLERTHSVHVYRQGALVSEFAKLFTNSHGKTQTDSPATTGKKHRAGDNFEHGFTQSFHRENEINASPEKSDFCNSPLKVIMDSKIDVSSNVSNSSIKIEGTVSNIQPDDLDVTKAATGNSEEILPTTGNRMCYATKAPQNLVQRDFPEILDLGMHHQTADNEAQDQQEVVVQVSDKENDYQTGNFHESPVLSRSPKVEDNKIFSAGGSPFHAEEGAIIKKKGSPTRMFDSDVRSITRYHEYTQDLEIPPFDPSSKSQLEDDTEENVTDQESKGTTPKMSHFGRKARKEGRSATALMAARSKKDKHRRLTSLTPRNDPGFRKSFSGSGTEESEESKDRTSFESKGLKRSSSSSQLVIIPEIEIYEEDPQADKQRVPYADMASISKGYYSDSSIRYSTPGVAQEKNE